MQKRQAWLITALEDSDWPTAAATELRRGAHIVPYEKRSTIFHAGESADLIYVLLSGEVNLRFDADNGADVLVAIAQRGHMLGMQVRRARGDPVSSAGNASAGVSIRARRRRRRAASPTPTALGPQGRSGTPCTSSN